MTCRAWPSVLLAAQLAMFGSTLPAAAQAPAAPDPLFSTADQWRRVDRTMHQLLGDGFRLIQVADMPWLVSRPPNRTVWYYLQRENELAACWESLVAGGGVHPDMIRVGCRMLVAPATRDVRG